MPVPEVFFFRWRKIISWAIHQNVSLDGERAGPFQIFTFLLLFVLFSLSYIPIECAKWT